MRITPENTQAILVDYQTSLMNVMYNREELARVSEILIRGLKALDIPMTISQQYTKGLGMSEAFVFEAAGTDKYMDKMCFSCYKEPLIREAIDAKEKKNVIVCGIEAHICVLQTCLDLKEAGYQPILIADAISSRTEANRKYALKRAIQEDVLVSTTEAILFELLQKAGGDVFKTISRLIK